MAKYTMLHDKETKLITVCKKHEQSHSPCALSYQHCSAFNKLDYKLQSTM